MLSLYLLLVAAVNSEILTFTTLAPPPSNTIQCQDAASECVINCNDIGICDAHELHCHATSLLACTINLNADYAAVAAIVQAHLSDTVTIACTNQCCGQGIQINAYERRGAQLFIDVSGSNALIDGYIYGPFGHNSYLSMICGSTSCYNMRIYDDWTTTVRLQSVGQAAFSHAQIRNIFDSGGRGISRSDYGTGAEMNYRGSVYIVECANAKDAMANFQYHGVNHGEWYVRVQGSYVMIYASLYMITDSRVDQSVKYPIKMYGIGDYSFRRNGRFDFGVGADVFIEARGSLTLFYSNFYARDANSLTIWCRGSTECSQMMVEAPQTDSPNSFNWICDDSAKCWGPTRNKVETVNGYACSNYYMSSKIDTRIFCGYDQSTQYSDLYLNYTSHWGGSCGTQCPFDNPITPVSIQTEMDALCDPVSVTIPALPASDLTEVPSTDPTTKAPSSHPTKSPSKDPTVSPSKGPTKSPSSDPTTASPSSGPTKAPSKRPTTASDDAVTTNYEVSVEIPSRISVHIPTNTPITDRLRTQQSTSGVTDSNDYNKNESEKEDLNATLLAFLIGSALGIIIITIAVIVMICFVMKSNDDIPSSPSTQPHDLKPKQSKQPHMDRATSNSEAHEEEMHDVEQGEYTNEGGDVLNADMELEVEEDIIAIAGINTFGEGDRPPPNNRNAIDFVDEAFNDEIIVGDDETDMGTTAQ